MRQFVFKHTISLFYTLGSVLLVLLLAVGYLYRQNNAVHHENRTLILQNDSIMSVNIELKNDLLQMQSAPNQLLISSKSKEAN